MTKKKKNEKHTNAWRTSYMHASENSIPIIKNYTCRDIFSIITLHILVGVEVVAWGKMG